MRWNPLARVGTIASPVVVAGATGAIAATQGFTNVQAAGAAGATAFVGVSALAGGVAAARSGIIRRPKSEEIGLARQIRQGLALLRDYLTQPTSGQRLPATPVLLVQPDDNVQKWVDQIGRLQQRAEKFADKRLATALSALVVTIQNIRAFVGRPQAELLALLAKEKAPETLKAQMAALLELELSEEERKRLMAAEADPGPTLEELVRLLLIGREPRAAALAELSSGKLLETVRQYALTNTLAAFRADGDLADVFREVMDKGGSLAQQIFDRDELEKGLAVAFWACDQIIGESGK